MRDGIQNIYDAFKKSPGNQNKNLANIKSGWKECNQVKKRLKNKTKNFYAFFDFMLFF